MDHGNKREGRKKKYFALLLRRSIRQGITRFFGRGTAVAVEFYLDSSLAEKDIVAYTKALERMFGAGSKMIGDDCAEILYRNLGIPFVRKESYSLSDYVTEARDAAATAEK
jgi:hypothetical protein